MSASDSEKRKKRILSELESVIIDLGVDDISTFGGKYEGGVHLQQVASEIAECIYDLKEVNRKFSNFLEIGSAAGGNTYLFNHFFEFDNIAIIDDNRHKKYALRQEVLKDVPHSEFIGDSHSEQAVKFLEGLQCNYDIIFIDGDHSYDGVKQDYMTFKDFLNYKGFVVFHDTFVCRGVSDFVFKLKKESLLFNPISPEILPVRFFGEYIGRGENRLGITVFQIHAIPEWRQNDGM